MLTDCSFPIKLPWHLCQKLTDHNKCKGFFFAFLIPVICMFILIPVPPCLDTFLYVLKLGGVSSPALFFYEVVLAIHGPWLCLWKFFFFKGILFLCLL